MKRIQFYRYGGPDEMRLESYALPAPRKGEIVVRVRAASVNPVDWKIRRGLMKMMTGNKFPRAMGQDFSGIVEAVGPSVTRLKVGDEVFGATPMRTSGSFAETLITQENLAVKKPSSISHEEAATLPVAATTAWIALTIKSHMRSGQTLFINGAYGAVGQAATQIARSLGVSVTGRVGPAVLGEAKALGMEAVLNYSDPLPSGLAGKFDVVLDAHGSLTVAEGNMLVKKGGLILDTNPSTAKMVRLIFSRSRKMVMGKQDAATLQEVADLASQGKLRLTVGRTVKLNDAIELIEALESGSKVKGKGLIAMV